MFEDVCIRSVEGVRANQKGQGWHGSPCACNAAFGIGRAVLRSDPFIFGTLLSHWRCVGFGSWGGRLRWAVCRVDV